MKIRKPIVSMIAKDTYCINEYGMDAMFLLVGQDMALLIDTGTGTFNVRELVESITTKPLTVVCSHGHVDHFGGAGYFGEVYLSSLDLDLAKAITVEDRQNYANILNEMSDGLFEIEKPVYFQWLPKIHELTDGMVFDLGNRDVVAYFTPGHTPGSFSFLDKKERILFSSDACNSNTLLLGGTLETLLETAKKLKALEPSYDRNYNGHIGYASYLDCLPQGYSVNSDAICLLEDLISGKAKGMKDASPFMQDALLATYGAFGVRYFNK